MADVLRQEIAALATSLVVKVGTQVLTGDDGLLDQVRIDQLAQQLHDVVKAAEKSCWSVPARSVQGWDVWA